MISLNSPHLLSSKRNTLTHSSDKGRCMGKYKLQHGSMNISPTGCTFELNPSSQTYSPRLISSVLLKIKSGFLSQTWSINKQESFNRNSISEDGLTNTDASAFILSLYQKNSEVNFPPNALLTANHTKVRTTSHTHFSVVCSQTNIQSNVHTVAIKQSINRKMSQPLLSQCYRYTNYNSKIGEGVMYTTIRKFSLSAWYYHTVTSELLMFVKAQKSFFRALLAVQLTLFNIKTFCILLERNQLKSNHQLSTHQASARLACIIGIYLVSRFLYNRKQIKTWQKNAT